MFSVFADDSDSDEECSKPTKKVTFKEEKKSVVLEVKELPKKQEKAVLSYASMVKKPASIPKEEPIPFLKNKKNTPSSGIINYEKFLKHNQLILKLRRGEMNWADLESDDEDW